jgi:iron-sulfur cluster insertion protein
MKIQESAVIKLRELRAEENNPDLKFRVFVQGGGCSGMQYGFTFDESQNEDDFDFQFDDLTVLVDAMSMSYLADADIRWQESDMGASFVIDNPQAETTCGCGSSFSPY